MYIIRKGQVKQGSIFLYKNFWTLRMRKLVAGYFSRRVSNVLLKLELSKKKRKYWQFSCFLLLFLYELFFFNNDSIICFVPRAIRQY